MAVRDKELQAEYNSAAPGTKLSPRFHAGFSNIMVVFEGEMRWDIENQTPFVATRGSIVNVAPMTMYPYEVIGAKPAIWVDVNPVHVDTVYQNAAIGGRWCSAHENIVQSAAGQIRGTQYAALESIRIREGLSRGSGRRAGPY